MKLERFAIAAVALSLSATAGAWSNSPSASSAATPGATASASATHGGLTASSTSGDEVREAQQQLQQQGFDVGPIDGTMGPRTEQALRQFQQQRGLQASGQLDAQTLGALGVNGEAGSAGTSNGSASMPGNANTSANATSSYSSGYTGSGQSASGYSSGGTSDNTTGSSRAMLRDDSGSTARGLGSDTAGDNPAFNDVTGQ